MTNVINLREFKEKKELEEEKKIASELQHLLSEIMLDDEPLIISYQDSSGTHYFNLDEIMSLSDSNPYIK